MTKEVTDLPVRLRKLRSMVSDDAQRLIREAAPDTTRTTTPPISSNNSETLHRPQDYYPVLQQFAIPPGNRSLSLRDTDTASHALDRVSSSDDIELQQAATDTTFAAQMVAKINARLRARGLLLSSDVALEVHQVVSTTLQKWSDKRPPNS